MDYEKKYKEALERAKQLSKELTVDDIVEQIFPELKESEDERVRNKLIEFFKGYFPDEEWWGNITQEDIIAYLEKQGEPKEINPSEFDSQLNRLLGQFKSLPKEELASSLSFYLNAVQNDGTYKEEKRGEQMPVKVPKFKVGDWIQFNGMGHTRYTIKEVCGLSHYINTYNKRMDMSYTDANFELVEQKYAEWSEEDESVTSLILAICNDYKESFKISLASSEAVQADIDRVDNWLKSIKGRVLPQPKQEWSEDTQQWIDAIIKDYEGWYDADIDHRATIQAKINILKSLRPQNTWKPSEEQIDLLQAIVNDTNNASSESCQIVLKEVIRQLKKLK